MSAEGFATIPRAVLYDETLHTNAKMVYLVLSSHVGANKDAWPSHATIAREASLSVSQVKRMLKLLRERGLVDWHTEAVGRMQTVNHYRVIAGTVPVPANRASSVRTGSHQDPGLSEPGPTRTPAPSSQSDERESSNDQQTSTPAAPSRPEVESLCARLADRIEGNGSKRPTITKGWRDAARLLLDRDDRTVEQVERAIDWCQADEFWRANVLSMPTLRRQYDKLRLAAQRTARPAAPVRDFDAERTRQREAARTNVPDWMRGGQTG